MVINEPVIFKIKDQQIESQGFIADYKTYFLELKDKKEALFLVAILNSPYINKRIKPMQSRGLWGPRDICKKVLEIPIPKYDPNNLKHKRLYELGEECSIKVENWILSGGPDKIKNIGKLRSIVRKFLSIELEAIDILVKDIII